MKKTLLISAILFAIAGAAVFYTNNVKANEAPKAEQKASQAASAEAPKNADDKASAQEESKEAPKVVDPKNKLFTEAQPGDIIMGEKSAPVKIIEYASLSCIHCKHFHDEVFYELKKRFVDTGKVQLTYRHFPLNTPAIKGALIVGCAPEDSKLAFLGALFKSQAQWAFVDNEGEMKDKLKTVAKIGGMDDATFEKCFNDNAASDKILGQMKQANDEIGVETTPSLFVDGVAFNGARTIESFAEIINEKLKNAKK
jgi:protein-disulfide isomerase